MTGQNACSFGAKRVPNVTVKVVIACEKQPARLTEGHAGDATDDVIVTVDTQLLVRPDVEHAAGGVVAPSGERVAIWEKRYGVDVTLVAGERLNTMRAANIPQLCRSITCAGDKGLRVWR